MEPKHPELSRLIEPSSEWALIDWAERTALPEMLGLRVTQSGKDRLYRAGDALFARRKALEEGLRRREAGLFESHGSIVLYDVTHTHFEGLCANNPKARHGKNKQKRNDCRQVAVGVAFDGRGLALAHDVFEGNIAETRTLEGMLDRLSLPRAEGAAKPVVILDAGFASRENLAMLKERGMGGCRTAPIDLLLAGRIPGGRFCDRTRRSTCGHRGEICHIAHRV